MKEAQKKGYDYEKKIAKDRNAKHIGGPGKPDYKKGSTLGEVKVTKTPTTTTDIKKALNKKVGEMESEGGFTKLAKSLAKKKLMTLREKGQVVR